MHARPHDDHQATHAGRRIAVRARPAGCAHVPECAQMFLFHRALPSLPRRNKPKQTHRPPLAASCKCGFATECNLTRYAPLTKQTHREAGRRRRRQLQHRPREACRLHLRPRRQSAVGPALQRRRGHRAADPHRLRLRRGRSSHVDRSRPQSYWLDAHERRGLPVHLRRQPPDPHVQQRHRRRHDVRVRRQRPAHGDGFDDLGGRRILRLRRQRQPHVGQPPWRLGHVHNERRQSL